MPQSNYKSISSSCRAYVLAVRDLPVHEKPRERLIAQGPEVLSVKELLSILLCSGTKKEGVLEMVDRIARGYGEKSLFDERNPSRLAQELSIPITKACQITAVGEIGRRFYGKSGRFPEIHDAEGAYAYLRDMGTLQKEHTRGLYLNSRNRIIRDEIISIGTADMSLIHPREVFRLAIECNASAVILAHNHPSGSTVASEADVQVTNQLIDAGRIIGIPLVDHLIVTDKGFSSILTA